MYLAVEVSFINMGKMKGEGTHFTSKKNYSSMEFIPVFLISGGFISFPFFVEFLDQMVTISRIIFGSIFRI